MTREYMHAARCRPQSLWVGEGQKPNGGDRHGVPKDLGGTLVMKISMLFTLPLAAALTLPAVAQQAPADSQQPSATSSSSSSSSQSSSQSAPAASQDANSDQNMS